jgi:hypothetical protein
MFSFSPHWTEKAPARPPGSGETPSGAAMRQAVTAISMVLARVKLWLWCVTRSRGRMCLWARRRDEGATAGGWKRFG